MRQSMGATGVCWDNAVAESAFSSLKNEFYHHHNFATRQDARRATMRYIEVFYNRMPDFLVGALVDSDRGVAAGELYDDSRTLSTLIGRPTTALSDAVKSALA